MDFMAIRNELVLKQFLAKAIISDARTFGIRFLDKAWQTRDTSVIYRRSIPSGVVLEAYSDIQLFNTLCNRNELILASKDYVQKDSRLIREHQEMLALAERVDSLASEALARIRT